MYEKPILERAFELARTGKYGRVRDIEKALAAEGYARGDWQIHCPTVRKQLRQQCKIGAGAVPAAARTVSAHAPPKRTRHGPHFSHPLL